MADHLQQNQAQLKLRDSVMDKGRCTGCGACTELCPYMKNHNADTIALFTCDRESGRCYQYCPRTDTAVDDIRKELFDPSDLTEELGAFKGLYMTRATNSDIRNVAQHGGTVTALVSLAMTEGLIEACVLADQDEKLLPKSFTAFNPSQVLKAAGSKFGNAPTVGEFNRISAKKKRALGVVATPCQALALAKMRTTPAAEDKERMSQLKLVIGLFCGWTLDWRKLNRLVHQAVDGHPILSLDIPPSKYACMQVTTAKGVMEIPMDQVNTCVRECCETCTDMTAEFADISVGSARSKEGWDVDKQWNQVIVRTKLGAELLALARKKELLEFKEISPENIAKLKSASLGKQKYGQSRLDEVCGNPDAREEK